MQKEISIIIPCYNEETTIIQVIDEIHTALPQAKIYVFDNNSSDNSPNLIKEKIHLIHRLDTNATGGG